VSKSSPVGEGCQQAVLWGRVSTSSPMGKSVNKQSCGEGCTQAVCVGKGLHKQGFAEGEAENTSFADNVTEKWKEKEIRQKMRRGSIFLTL